jgi:hypothetical protein
MGKVGIFYVNMVYVVVILVYFAVIWYILRISGIFCGYLVYFANIWYILRLFGIFCEYLVYFAVIRYILRISGIFCEYMVYVAVGFVYFAVIRNIFSTLACCTLKNIVSQFQQ